MLCTVGYKQLIQETRKSFRSGFSVVQYAARQGLRNTWLHGIQVNY